MENKVKFGLKVPFYPMELIMETANYADIHGYDSLWSADHMVGISPTTWDSFSVWSLLSAFAVKTRNVLLGSSVTDACRMSPAVLSQIAMTIDNMSGGRFVLGIGTGEGQNTLPYGVLCDHPVVRLREMIEIVKKLLSEDNVTYKGKCYSVQKASINPKPVGGKRPPIWIASNSTRTMKMTGILGDGWLPMAIKYTPDTYGNGLEKIRSVAKTAGRDPDAIEPALFIHTAISDDYDSARKVMEDAGRLMFLVWGPERFEEMGVGTDESFHSERLIFDKPMARRLAEVLPKLPVEPIHKYLVFGTPDNCIEGFERYAKAGVKHFVVILFAPPAQYKKSLQLFTEKVLAHFKGS